MRNDPDFREPRLPAVAIWTVTGLLLGLAFTIVAGNFPLPALIGGVLGLLGGLYLTRVKKAPGDD